MRKFLHVDYFYSCQLRVANIQRKLTGIYILATNYFKYLNL